MLTDFYFHVSSHINNMTSSIMLFCWLAENSVFILNSKSNLELLMKHSVTTIFLSKRMFTFLLLFCLKSSELCFMSIMLSIQQLLFNQIILTVCSWVSVDFVHHDSGSISINVVHHSSHTGQNNQKTSVKSIKNSQNV